MAKEFYVGYLRYRGLSEFWIWVANRTWVLLVNDTVIQLSKNVADQLQLELNTVDVPPAPFEGIYLSGQQSR